MKPDLMKYLLTSALIGVGGVLAERGYNGAHYDHFANFFNAIRENGKVVQDPVFAFRAAAPALLCNDSYFQDKFIKWDPINMKLV